MLIHLGALRGKLGYFKLTCLRSEVIAWQMQIDSVLYSQKRRRIGIKDFRERQWVIPSDVKSPAAFVRQYHFPGSVGHFALDVILDFPPQLRCIQDFNLEVACRIFREFSGDLFLSHDCLAKAS